jgi:hypothetical protein
MTGRRGKRRRKLLDYLKKMRGCFHRKEEALDQKSVTYDTRARRGTRSDFQCHAE